MALEAQGSRRPYIGRFAPSPTGPLHDGSLLAAMASFLDARAHRGKWLLRIEDIDTPRVVAGADQIIMTQLRALDMHWDEPPTWQSHHLERYQAAFDQLAAENLVYGCACTRQELPWGAYPGTCREGLPPGREARAWRFKVPSGIEHFHDRWQGPQQQDVAGEVGDFIVRRADGLWAYQMVVVVDDGAQGITDIVRGEDLLDSTARQRVLARHLHIEYPRVMHIPVLMDDDGRKLSKQNHAEPLDIAHPLHTLNQAWQALGFPPVAAGDLASFWSAATTLWAQRFSVS